MGKENLRFDNQSKQFVFLFLLPCFPREKEKMFSVFLSSFRNTCESLRELKKLWEHLCAACVPTAFLVLPRFHLNVLLQLNGNIENMFSVYEIIIHSLQTSIIDLQ